MRAEADAENSGAGTWKVLHAVYYRVGSPLPERQSREEMAGILHDKELLVGEFF